MLAKWIRALEAAKIPKVHHIVLVAGDPLPSLDTDLSIRFIPCEVGQGIRPSIGYLHNIGVELACTEWVMKMDVDAIPNAYFFAALLDTLQHAGPREWFNVGMFYMSKWASETILDPDVCMLDPKTFGSVINDIKKYSASTYNLPAATNFVCRRNDYKKLGGCDHRFQGWGWEDYQQIYMLERHQRVSDPLPGNVDIENVTHRCRDEISRRKAYELFRRNNLLALLHHWHPASKDPHYKDTGISDRNRRVLLDYIHRRKQEPCL